MEFADNEEEDGSLLEQGGSSGGYKLSNRV
jgi:hypothetical protein